MSRPWMPLYIADYIADTMHFSASEHGAYLLLIMHYWQNGSLPNDDARLARIVRMSEAEWAQAKAVIEPKFGSGWRHARIDGELAEAERLAKAGKKGGAASAEKRKRNARPKDEHEQELGLNDRHDDEAYGQRFGKQTANDLATTGPTIPQAPHPQPQKIPEAYASGAHAPVDPSIAEREFFARGREVLGKNAGGQLALLKKAKGHNVSLARAAIETAATKHNPAEYIAAVIRGPPVARAATVHQQLQAEGREILDEMRQFNTRPSSREDPGLLRHDPGDGPESVRGGTGGNLVDLSSARDRSCG